MSGKVDIFFYIFTSNYISTYNRFAQKLRTIKYCYDNL